MKLEFIGPKREQFGGSWTRSIAYAGGEYQVSLRPGKRVRIPYKPRGQNWGYHWEARVFRVKGKPSERLGQIWYAPNVGKSAGCARLLEEALRHEFMEMAFGKNYARDWWFFDYAHNDPRRYRIFDRLREAERGEG